jgi:predicted secreted protein
VLALVLVALSSVVAACSSTIAPPSAGLAVTCAMFEADGGAAPLERDLAVGTGQTFTVTLCSNPSTGFSWEEPTAEGDHSVELVERSILQTVGGPPGEAGQEQFTFRATAAGTTVLHFVYSQPWDGGTKGAWRHDLTVTVT